jgi:hypothetical protein
VTVFFTDIHKAELRPCLPSPPGAMTAALFEALCEPVGPVVLTAETEDDVLASDDFQLALYVLYELHYRGFADVDEAWEWEPSLLAFRRELETSFGDAVRDVALPVQPVAADELDLALREILDAGTGPSLSRFIETRASYDQFIEFVIHRSAYQLKEADPHSWAIPRLDGPPKAALIAIQSDEYGEGVASRLHSELFRQTMISLGLDGHYGAYLDVLPAATLATVNLMSMFGLHRRWRGAIVGHLAAFEMSSALPNRRYGNGLRRLGRPDACAFYDEHVVADSVHENLAAVDLAGGLAKVEPELAEDILFGASSLVALDRAFAEHLMRAWDSGVSSLRATSR